MKNKLMSTSLLTSVLVATLFVTAGYVYGHQFDMISDLTIAAFSLCNL